MNKHSLSDKIINKIQSARLKPKVRAWFVWRSLLLVLAVTFVILLILFLTSFVIFMSKDSISMLGPGLPLAVRFLPGLLLLLAVILIIALEILAKKFSWAWRQPLLYSLLAIMLIIMLGGVLFDKARLHPRMLDRAQKGQMPPVAGQLYRGYHQMRSNFIHSGKIVEINDTGLVMETPAGQSLIVVIDDKTRLPQTQLQAGDRVIIMGELKDSEIKAKAIRLLKDTPEAFFRPRNNSCNWGKGLCIF